MKLSIVHKFSTTAVLLVILSIALVGWVFYSKTTEVLVKESLQSISQELINASARVREHIASQNEDVLFLADMPPIQGMLRTQNKEQYDYKDKSTYNQWVKRQQQIFITMLKSKPHYLSIRFIDASGYEKIVVARQGSEIVALNNESLQIKSQRNYFKDSIKLTKGAVYLSEINLHRDYGKVTFPHQGVLRSSSPVYNDVTGKVAGILLITADIEHQLNAIRNDIQDRSIKIYITNDKGDYLLHPDTSKIYGFDLGKRYQIQEDIPDLEKLYSSDDKVIEYILRPRDKDSQFVINFSKIYFDPNKPSRFIAVGITQRYSSIVKKQAEILSDVLLITVLLILVSGILAIVFSNHLSRPLKQMTLAIDDYMHHRESDIVMPSHHNDEIGVLARSYELLIENVENANFKLKELNESLEVRVADRIAKLDISERRQRSIVENMVDGLITIDEIGEVLSFNSAAIKLFGYHVDEVIGRNIKMLMPEQYKSEHDLYLRNYKQSSIKKIIGIGREVEGLRKDGSTFPLELAVSEMTVNGDKIFTGVVRDITERNQMDKMKNEFISTVSHELRTPLTSIRGSLSLLLNGTIGDLSESVKGMLNIASSNTERLLLIINDILDMQKIESGQMNFNFTKVNLKKLIEQAIIEHAEYGRLHDVTFVMKNIINDAYVLADKDRLMQVFGNLLSNAAKFSTKGSAVDISVYKEKDDRFRISVTDYGVGIAKDFQSKLFERFTQSDSSDTRSKGGTGLGLSISKMIIEKHNGLIGFVSKEGIGSTFYIELSEINDEFESSNL